eukprot:scaffold94987_cov76-Cyclotella_meneghiniana.AAC.1
MKLIRHCAAMWQCSSAFSLVSRVDPREPASPQLIRLMATLSVGLAVLDASRNLNVGNSQLPRKTILLPSPASNRSSNFMFSANSIC